MTDMTIPLKAPLGASTLLPISIIGEQPGHDGSIEALHERVFGPGRFARAAFRVREQGGYDPSLSFVAVDGSGDLLGSTRQTWIVTSQCMSKGLLLGPLCVSPDVQNKGIGKQLVAHCIAAAKQTDANYVMLVGDQPYYGPLGFEIVPGKQVTMPGPVDLNRLLVCPIGGFDAGSLSGRVTHVDAIGI